MFLTYKDADVERFVNSAHCRERGILVESETASEQPSLWDSKIELSEKFFNEIIQLAGADRT